MSNRLRVTPNDLSAFWMPFTANRQFKQAPRMLVSAKDMHYTATDGRKILDGTAGLWCVNAGHCRPKIVEAIQNQAGELDYAPDLPDGPSGRFRTRQPAGRHRAGGHGARLLHEFRLRIGRHRAEDGDRLSPRQGRRRAHAPDRPRARLSRRQFRRHLGRRHRHQPQDVRHAAGGVDHLPHTHLPARTPSRAASRSTARSSPTSWSASWPCTTPRPSPPSSSSRWPARPAC